MPLEFTFRPIDRWPGSQTPHHQRGNPFKAGWQDTMNKLRHELGQLRARNPVIMMALTESEFRRDGLPRADARPSHPGVIVAFDSKFGPLKMPCDACRDWQQNVRAIAYHLEHLRLSGLYGVGRFGEQYTGWKALPPAIAAASMTTEQAARFVAEWGGVGPWSAVLTDQEFYRRAYRAAALKLHPDQNAGQHRPEWDRLQEAATLLDARVSSGVTA